jgi:hypothetical protein
MYKEQRTEIRRTFLEGQGHLVEEVPIDDVLKPGQAVVTAAPAAPPVKVELTVSDVSLDLACRVCEAAGLVVVPVNFLNPEQLQELKIVAGAFPAAQEPNSAQAQEVVSNGPGTRGLNAEQAIERIKLAASFEELNSLMAEETRKTVIAAAEVRAEELKAQGAK